MIDWAERSVEKDAVPNEVTRKEGTWEKERGREGTATEKSDIKMNWAAVFALSLSLSLHFLLNQFFSAVVTLSRRPIDSPERKGGGNPIYLFVLRMMCGLISQREERERVSELHD